MRYYATTGGKQRTIDVERLDGGKYSVSVDSAPPQIVDAARVEPSVLSVLARDRSYDVVLERDEAQTHVTLDGAAFTFELFDERQNRQRQAKQGSVLTGPVIVRAPMPGKVVKILVKEGQDVAEQEGLVIIEAMKMENELRSPKAGRVTAIKVKEGQTVDSRAELISVE